MGTFNDPWQTTKKDQQGVVQKNDATSRPIGSSVDLATRWWPG
jgi:hypothetical protein